MMFYDYINPHNKKIGFQQKAELVKANCTPYTKNIIQRNNNRSFFFSMTVKGTNAYYPFSKHKIKHKLQKAFGVPFLKGKDR